MMREHIYFRDLLGYHCAMTDVSACLYLLPVIFALFTMASNWWALAFIGSLALGLWLAEWKHRIIATVGWLGILFIKLLPENTHGDIPYGLAIWGFCAWLSCRLDGIRALKEKWGDLEEEHHA